VAAAGGSGAAGTAAGGGNQPYALPPAPLLPSDADVPLMLLSPSLTPRNPTPHLPAVRLYTLATPTATRAARLDRIEELTFDLDASNKEAGGEAGTKAGTKAGGEAGGEGVELGAHLRWSVASLADAYNLSDVGSPLAWGKWAHRLAHDDATFGMLMSPHACADQVESEYAVCKASVVCAMLEVEPRPYARCLQAVRSGARAPSGWVPAVKRAP
jgi:hypothetical protein